MIDLPRFDVHALVEHGFEMTIPARSHDRFTESAACRLIGSYTMLTAHELGVDHEWRMQITAARIIDGGRALMISLRRPELRA